MLALLDIRLGLQPEPGGIISWIVVGLIAGALASRVVAGRGFGCLADLAVGVVGAFVGGYLIGLFVPGTAVGFLGTILVAFVGATILLALLKLLSGGKL